MERTKESAMRAIAKRPKLFPLLMKGDKTIHELKKAAECSGGLIRTIVWAGVAVINEDKTIKFVKGIKQSDIPSLDTPRVKEKGVKKPSKTEKEPLKKAKEGGKKNPAPKPSKVIPKPSKKEVKEGPTEEVKGKKEKLVK